jgi:hypothetical protein
MTDEELSKLILYTKCATLQMFAVEGYKDNNSLLLNEPKYPFSGCFYKDYILSVLHGYDKGDLVTAFISSEEGIKMANLVTNWIKPGTISKNGSISLGTELDFFIASYDKTEKFLCEIMDDDTDELSRYERVKFNEIVEPNIADTYFFGGNIHSAKDNLTKRIFSDFQFAICDYCGEYAKDGNDFYYKFELQGNINSEDDLRGCSGAPIFNGEGELVSLLCGGFVGTPYVYGINLFKLKPLIECPEFWQ